LPNPGIFPGFLFNLDFKTFTMRLLNIKQLTKPSFLLIVLLGCGLVAIAQTKKPVKAVAGGALPVVAVKGAQSYVETFFKKYKVSPDSAVDYLFGTNKLFTNRTTQINVLKSKLDSLQLTLGKYTGKELLVEKSASPSLVLYSYLVKHENQPVRFTFIFYKSSNEWSLYRFNYDDQMDVEMFEAAKINNKR
jgi:hypothetical protein